MVISYVGIGDVEGLHVEINMVVGGSYLDIEDLCYCWSKFYLHDVRILFHECLFLLLSF
jgi:hypothetical protein